MKSSKILFVVAALISASFAFAADAAQRRGATTLRNDQIH
jgi:hypothetical protein